MTGPRRWLRYVYEYKHEPVTQEQSGMIRRLVPGLMMVLLSGCSSLSYYGQLAGGQWQLLQARVPRRRKAGAGA
ncbi:hypothetical protein AO262_11485 [Pseudomonas fluorescens ABAC62]|nr:hypothetical protein AO262_11485 [Pseudomonas fluorescens ABAC62]